MTPDEGKGRGGRAEGPDALADGAGGRSLRYALIIFAIIEALVLIPFVLYKIFR